MVRASMQHLCMGEQAGCTPSVRRMLLLSLNDLNKLQTMQAHKPTRESGQAHKRTSSRSSPRPRFGAKRLCCEAWLGWEGYIYALYILYAYTLYLMTQCACGVLLSAGSQARKAPWLCVLSAQWPQAMMTVHPDPINFEWAQANPAQISAEDYSGALRELGKYMAKNLPKDIRAEAIPPLDEDVKRDLILGDFTSNKPVKEETLRRTQMQKAILINRFRLNP